MNKLYTLALAICATSLSFGQISYDLQLDLVTPTSGSTIPASSTVSVDFTLTNNGPDAIPTGDTLFFVYTDGTGSAVFSFTNVAGQASGVILAADFTSGMTLTASTELTGPLTFDLSAFPNGETCNVVCLGSGSAVLAGADPNDTNPLNNLDSFMISAAADLDELNEGVVIYPNPAVNVLNVQASEEVASINVIGLDGSIVSTSVNSNQVDVSTLGSGIYVYQVELASGKVVTDKFIKK